MYGMPGMPGATAGMTMPMAGMNMAGMNMTGMPPGSMPMPVGPPTSGSDGNVPAQNYGGFGMSNAAAADGSMTGGYGQKSGSGEDYGRLNDRNSYHHHPYKR